MKEGFYNELIHILERSEGNIWTETVLSGERAGEKRICTERPQESPALFCERIGRLPRLVVCGGGHVSVPIIRIGKMLGFAVTVLEDRLKFADHARQAGADIVRCGSFSEGLSHIRGNSDTWFVIVTRGHRYDTECLQAILGKMYAYVGMMGSRRRVDIVKNQLEKQGIRKEVLNGVHAPIGLRIGAQTPEEIAVSVMAEIIQIKSVQNKTVGYSQPLLSALVSSKGERGGGDTRQKVLATIISRKGSAPRDIGTKMLVFEDGNTIDTIGGGCVESQIIQKALLMMRVGNPEFDICRVDMRTEDAEEEGMVCGGVVEVMLEKVR